MKRYYQKSNGGFIEHKDGDWIKAQDCKDLRTENEEYRKALEVFERYVIDVGCSYSGEGESFECDYAYPWECPDCPINTKAEYIEDMIVRQVSTEDKGDVCGIPPQSVKQIAEQTRGYKPKEF